MKVLILHDELGEDARADESDVFVQRDVVATALGRLGHTVVAAELGLDLSTAASRIRAERPDVVFNLVESVARTGRLIHLAPSLFDTLDVPYTGASADAVYLTSNKLLAKRAMRAAGLPTPDAVDLRELRQGGWPGPGRFLVKSVWEHGSVGIDAGNVVDVESAHAMEQALARLGERVGGHVFAERFVDGREFNLSVLAGPDGPEVLPPAEIRFVDWDPDAPRIVDYRAKWDTDSREYHATPRTFEFHESDEPLLDELSRLARASWTTFALGGYARVDFRVDERGGPWILEVNTNPCLSPDAGFAAAVQRAGLNLEDAVARIVDDALS